MNCGRELGGSKVEGLGICPAAIDSTFNGLNSGKNGGRICWAVAGTFCDGEVQGFYAEKLVSCMSCGFFILVKEEEGTASFDLLKPGQVYRSRK
jgi:DNA-directed RNA polymerase subunit RPC12/RpoP